VGDGEAVGDADGGGLPRPGGAGRLVVVDGEAGGLVAVVDDDPAVGTVDPAAAGPVVVVAGIGSTAGTVVGTTVGSTVAAGSASSVAPGTVRPSVMSLPRAAEAGRADRDGAPPTFPAATASAGTPRITATVAPAMAGCRA
jgi:hypothetical protein